MTGVMLLEVVLAIAVFAFGMLALVQLQGNLTRSSADANTRTVATNIAEEIVERIRGDQQVTADPDNDLVDYLELVGNSQDTVVRRGRLGNADGGLDYTVSIAITDFWYDPATDAFKDTDATDPPTPPAGLEYLAWADFKLLAVNVSWSPNPDFYVDDENTANLGADGSTDYAITIYEIIPSSPPALGAKIAADLDPPKGVPPVDYTPGLKPDIVAIDLLNGKLKESTTPMPDVIRRDEFVETWFDVITYNSDPSNVFLRREEFLVVSCQCKLRFPSGDAVTGFLPTVWTGAEYTEGEFVAKPFGESDSNQQSIFCDTCCRDHHDGATGKSGDDQVYDPMKTWTSSKNNISDHEHYKPGGLTLAANSGDSYVEACRMVRKDGFMRVAQDFRQEGFVAFPEDFLDETAEIEDYSTYVTEAIKDFYINDRDALTTPEGVTDPVAPAISWSGPYEFPASTEFNPTTLPTAGGNVSQQLRARGIYIDHISAETREVIDCMIPKFPSLTAGDECGAPGAGNFLEVLPFFDIQTTKLSWWVEDTGGNPVEVSNEALEDNNSHSRGRAKKISDTAVDAKVTSKMHRGNVGLAVVDPVDPYTLDGMEDYELFVNANGGGGSPVTGPVVSGTFTSMVGGVNASGATIIPATGTVCSRVGDSLSCTTDSGNSFGSITISGYFKNAATDLWICPSNFTVEVTGVVSAGLAKTTTLTWVNSGQEGFLLEIEKTSCSN